MMCARREANRTQRRWCSGLDLRVERYDPHIRILRVSGSLTDDHAERFCMVVREQLALIPRLLVLEVSRVAAVDSAGEHALVQAARLADEAGIRLALVTGISTAVDTILRANGLTELFEVHSRLGPAISSMTGRVGPHM